MEVAVFPCPHCEIPLRVKDRGYVGRQIKCPECKAPVAIVDEAGTLRGVTPPDAADRRPTTPLARRRLSPAVAGWSVAACLVIGIGLFLLAGPSDVADEPSPQEAATVGDVDVPQADEDSPAESIAVRESASTRLEAIPPMLDALPNAGLSFPPGTVRSDGLPPAKRLSWIAMVDAAGDSAGPAPRWDLAWTDPANERFVRRQLPAWLNPAVPTVVGEQRYPATHFVGVAGIGEDAASLPADHRRAGIFGHDRQVQLADVGDGLANTMLVAGVDQQLGSWAAGGRATVRSFTAEPFINGPDGFGTGQADGMHVLMADGSVRFISRETDPVVIRRMATMNDGLPLDPQVPDAPPASEVEPPQVAMEAEAEKGAAKPQAEDEPPQDPVIEAARVIAEIARPQDMPIDVTLADPVVVYDVETALRQKIAEFHQKEPVPARDLLDLIEEMAAVPIRFDEMPPDLLRLLDRPVTLSLNETTVGTILQSVLDALGLAYEGRPEGIFVHGLPDAASAAEPAD